MDQPEMLVICEYRGLVASCYGSDPDVLGWQRCACFAECNYDFCVDARRIVIHVENFNQRMGNRSN